LGLAGCFAAAPDPAPPDASPARGCGPVEHADVRGQRPAYARGPLDRFPNDEAVCAAIWLRTGDGFIPQGLAVDRTTAWVSGFDGDARVGHRFCTVLRIDLRSGRELERVHPVAGQVGTRPPVVCRHGGGLARDTHGLWLVETGRLWLLDPDTLLVRRAWNLERPLRGSFALLDGDGRLGVGGWNPDRRGRLFWFDTDALVATTALDLTPALTTGSRRVPRSSQGALWGAYGRVRAGVWFARSVTRCGTLVGPGGIGERGFVPGAEGMAPAGRGHAWVVSETGTRYYQRQGGRPLLPTLLRVDLRAVAEWSAPDCSV